VSLSEFEMTHKRHGQTLHQKYDDFIQKPEKRELHKMGA